MKLEILWDAAGGDGGFARQLADLFCVQIVAQLALLRAALTAGSAPRVQSIAHHCKGSSHTCGAVTLAALFGELARLGQAGQLEQAPPVLAEIEREFARVQAVFSALPERLPGAPA